MTTLYKSAINISVVEKPDHELIRKVAVGDIESFDFLYQQFSRPIFGYLVRLVYDQHIAEDLLQEVFIAVWTGASRFRGHATVKTWIFQIAHNQAVSWIRKKKATSSREQYLEDSYVEGPEDFYNAQWVHEQVRTAMIKLSTEHRSVIELVFYFGMSYSEVATIMRCPIGTVKSRMSYARRYLEQYLKGISGYLTGDII